MNKISVRADFDSGALKHSEVRGNHILLHPAPYLFNGNPTGNWFYVLIEGAKGQDLTLSFATEECDLHGYQSENKLSLSTDDIHWEVIPDSTGAGNEYQCQFHATSNRVWVAQPAPYPMGRVTSKVAKWLENPCVHPARSADAKGRIRGESGEAWMTSGDWRGVSGQAIPSFPLYALEVFGPGVSA